MSDQKQKPEIAVSEEGKKVLDYFVDCALRYDGVQAFEKVKFYSEKTLVFPELKLNQSESEPDKTEEKDNKDKKN